MISLDGPTSLDSAAADAVPAMLPEADNFSVRARLSRIMQGADFPALSRQIIDTITTIDDDASSLQRLANLVLREYGLTLSVVRMANSAHYRRGGRSTQSATHAMMMLGAQVVRKMAASMLLFENFSRRSPELKELMLLSLLTANHARATALQLGLEDPEEAHLCGMFRNLGEVLIAGYFHDDYRRIRSLIDEDGRSEAAALRMVLGFPYADFGVAVANQWGLPDTVSEGIRARANASSSLLASVTAFSHDLTAALYRQQEIGDIGPALDIMVSEHHPRIRLSREQMSKVASEALKETQELLTGTEPSRTQPRFKQLAMAARQAFGSNLVLPSDDGTTELPEPDLSTRARMRSELESIVDPASTATIGNVLLQALEVILRGGPFDRVVVCFMTADRTQLVARTGLGKDVESLIAKFSFPVTARGGPVVILTQQRQPVYLSTDRALTSAEQRWATELGVRQFGVFPLIVLGKVIGCIYADRVGDAATPDRATVRYTKSIADQVVEAIARRRA